MPSLLPSAVTAKPKIEQALARLCSLKNQAQFSLHGLDTWCAALSIFPAAVVNRAVLEIALSPDPFPDCGKVIAKCQAEMNKRSNQVTQADPAKPSRGTVNKIAEAFQILVD